MLLNAPINAVPVKPIYLIYGGEIWQSNDTIKKISKFYTGLSTSLDSIKKYYFANFLQFIQFKNTNGSEIFNLDLFCEKKINKLIKINIGNGKFTKQQQEELINLLNNLDLEQNNFVIILIAERLDQTTLNTNWFKTINKIGAVITTKQLSTNDMQKWAVDQFKQANLKISNEALVKFITMYQNNLQAAAQSIYKLKISCSNEEIDLKILMDFISDESQFSLFDLQNALVSNNVERIVYLLNSLKNHGQETILILWAIIKAIKNILAKTNNQKIKDQMYHLLPKAGEIDLAIKNFDTENKINGSSNSEYIWSLIMDLCLDFHM